MRQLEGHIRETQKCAVIVGMGVNEPRRQGEAVTIQLHSGTTGNTHRVDTAILDPHISVHGCVTRTIENRYITNHVVKHEHLLQALNDQSVGAIEDVVGKIEDTVGAIS